ncbi:TrmO family methyltransferase domain-containing protein [Marinilabilia salmonicolor]|uniref:TrmO family methyltransferase domain-containing protein n=1 Tax=Marinilabilia salmonicolor TaxID=989 RepID=UPI0003166A3C|nr:TrmO family methyltransferase [Marinilabilia salmonicolor]
MMTFEPIGRVKNELTEKRFIKNAESIVSEILINDHFLDGLYKIEEQKYIDVLFEFHQSDGYQLITPVFNGETRGVFASRSPNRPNGIGVTTVRLIERKGNKLFVSGLDALNDSPVYDLKPSDFSFYRNLQSRDDLMLSRPRINIEKHISRGESRALLQQAGQLHGHYCPGLAMGVLATMNAMDLLRQASDGMEELLAFVETNNCFSDGVQYISGCTFGNNALIFQDYGKNAVSIVSRDGRGYRARAKNDIRQVIGSLFPDFNPLFEKVVVEKNHEGSLKQSFKEVSKDVSFGMLEIPFDEMFDLQEVKLKIPDYAPIEESSICDECGEVFMSSRGICLKGRRICHACNDIHHPFLDGYGIHCV